MLVNLFHILLIGPYLIYVGLAKPSFWWVYVVLLLLALLVLITFMMHVVKGNVPPWIMVHGLLFTVLLGYMGILGVFYGRDKVPDYTFAFTLAIGLAALAYHSVKSLILT